MINQFYPSPKGFLAPQATLAFVPTHLPPMPLQSRRYFLGLSTGTLASALLPAPVKRLFAPPAATCTVHLDQPLGDINPAIYGQFIEHLGRAIYGGIYDEPTRSFRPDVLAKVQGLRPTLLRYPGGTVTKIYHWKDGVGPNRPVRKNLIWGGNDSNHVGTDEFMRYAELVGAAPFLTVNMSTGTAEEAADWVEYCNGTDTYYATQRQANGHPQPYRVQYWGLGNEEAAKEDAGTLQDPRDYIKKAWYYAKLMKLQDPSITLIMAGDQEDWNRQILQELHPICDYLSLHLYASSKPGDPASLFIPSPRWKPASGAPLPRSRRSPRSGWRISASGTASPADSSPCGWPSTSGAFGKTAAGAPTAWK